MPSTPVRPDPFDAAYSVPVDGGRMFVARAGERPVAAEHVVVALHGVTASHVTWRAPAREVVARARGVSFLAPDLRGRGRSAELPPPERFSAHVDDVVSLLDRLEVDRAVLAGHSMGAYVAAGVAAEHRERVAGLVLVDAGLPMAVQEGTDPEQLLEATLGPALDRLHMTFQSTEQYLSFWHAHPAFHSSWNEDMEAYLRADIEGRPGAMHSVTSEDAVRLDSTALLLDESSRTALERADVPVELVRAERGLLDDDQVMVPDALLAPLLEARPDIRTELVEGVNHYTIVMGDGAPRVAEAILRRLG